MYDYLTAEINMVLVGIVSPYPSNYFYSVYRIVPFVISSEIFPLQTRGELIFVTYM